MDFFGLLSELRYFVSFSVDLSASTLLRFVKSFQRLPQICLNFILDECASTNLLDLASYLDNLNLCFSLLCEQLFDKRWFEESLQPVSFFRYSLNAFGKSAFESQKVERLILG